MGKVISVLNPKGGTGKTTISLNLARALQLDGFDVVLGDSDPQGTARAWSSLGVEGSEMFPVYGLGTRTIDREIGKVKDACDFVVIDGGAKLDIQVMAPIIRSSDLILIPVRPSGADIWAADELVGGIKALQDLLGGKPVAFFVVSSQVIGTLLAEEIRDVLEKLGLPVLKARTSQRVSYTEALTSGLTVFEEDRDGKASREVSDIKNEILAVLNG
jgi:chromosome partitioning protein